MALETADVQIIALVDLLGRVRGPEANAGMPDAFAASRLVSSRGLDAESSPGLRTATQGVGRGGRRRIERKERMRTIGHKSRVWPTIAMAIVTLTVCWGQATPSEACRAACCAACREARRVHRRGAVHRMPRPGEQAFQRDAACEGLPAESEERRSAAGLRSLPRTGLESRQERARQDRAHRLHQGVGERRWTCRMPSA